MMMVLGSWLKAHSSCLKAHGSKLMAKEKHWREGPGPGGTPRIFSLAMTHEP